MNLETSGSSGIPNDISFMELALEEAELAFSVGEVPVGAIIVHKGIVIARAHNVRETTKDPTAHAELIAIKQASANLESWRLEDCTLYVTLEPCLMCGGAILNSRIPRVVFGCADPKGGALGSLYNVGVDPRLNHEFEITHSVLEENSSNLLSKFFSGLRSH